MIHAISALALSLALQAPQDSRAPGPLSGIDGLAGFSSVSRITFPDESSPPHRLEAVYLYPGRARWRLLALGGRASDRMLVYRFGGNAHQLQPGRSASETFEGDSRAKTLLQIELRRAAMTWPSGFHWTGSGERRSAEVRPGPEALPVGTLMAELGEDGRPQRIRALNLGGQELEAFEIEDWQVHNERTWPRSLVLSQNGRRIWTEKVESVQTKVYFVDLFFQPPDQRSSVPSTLPGGRQILSLDLQGITFRSRPLERGTTLAEALEEARDWAEEAHQGPPLDAVPTLELDHGGRPRSILQRLETREDTPPEGWDTIGDRPGLALVLPDLASLNAGLLTELLAAVPQGSRAGAPYCRIVAGKSGHQVQVYLPLEAQ